MLFTFDDVLKLEARYPAFKWTLEKGGVVISGKVNEVEVLLEHRVTFIRIRGSLVSIESGLDVVEAIQSWLTQVEYVGHAYCRLNEVGIYG